MIELNAETFDETIQSEAPVAVDFWAEWCMPCKIFAPVWEKLEDELSGKVTFCKLNVDDCGDIAIDHGIASIPTIIVFQNGEAVKQFVGVLPKDELKSALEGLVK